MIFSQIGRRRHSCSPTSSLRAISASKSWRRRAATSRVAHDHVDLVVVLERAVVEVGRPDGRPQPVHFQALHVRHPGLILVDPHARFQELPVHPPAGESNPALIGLGAGQDDADIDPARRRPDERLAEGLVRQEVRRRDADLLVRALDQDLKEHARGRGAVRRRALHREGGRLPGLVPRLVGLGAGQDFAAALEPVLRHDALNVRDDRAFESQHHVAPQRFAV